MWLATTPRDTYYWTTASQFFDNSVWQPLVDKLRNDASYSHGPLDRHRGVLPSAEPEQLAEEFVRELPRPGQPLLGDTGFENAMQIVTVPNLMIVGRLVDSSRNLYFSEGALYGIGLFGDPELPRLKNPSVTCFEPYLAYLW